MSDSESEDFDFHDDDEDNDFDLSEDDDEDNKKKRKKSNVKKGTEKRKTNEKGKVGPKKKQKVEEAKQNKSDATSKAPVIVANSNSGNHNMIMKGPPVSTPLEARNLVKDYMLQQNRPYSLIQIHDNLHGRVAKPQLQRGSFVDDL